MTHETGLTQILNSCLLFSDIEFCHHQIQKYQDEGAIFHQDHGDSLSYGFTLLNFKSQTETFLFVCKHVLCVYTQPVHYKHSACLWGATETLNICMEI